MTSLMTHASVRLAAACGTALLLAFATLPASAAYTGYGNGDPGNWDFWTEQNGGRTPGAAMTPNHAHLKHVHHAHHHRPANETKPS